MKIDELEKKMPHLYLDMDGVQADFFGAWADRLGVDHWKAIHDKEKEINIAIGTYLSEWEGDAVDVFNKMMEEESSVNFSDIDYAMGRAETTYGSIGVKVWINRGEEVVVVVIPPAVDRTGGPCIEVDTVVCPAVQRIQIVVVPGPDGTRPLAPHVGPESGHEDVRHADGRGLRGGRRTVP